jgi:hypothetical protein
MRDIHTTASKTILKMIEGMTSPCRTPRLAGMPNKKNHRYDEISHVLVSEEGTRFRKKIPAVPAYLRNNLVPKVQALSKS